MTIKTRRLLAATLTSALVAAPALVCSGPAHAGTAAPSGILGSVLPTATGTLPLPAPLNTLVNTIVTAVDSAVPTGGTGGTGSGSTDPATVVTSLVNGLAGAVTSGDPTQVLTGLQDQLAGFGFAESDITEVLGGLNPGDLEAISAGLLDLVPLDQLFGGATPKPIADILGQTGAKPTDTAGLIAALTAFYQSQGKTEPDPAVKQSLPKSALEALLLALSKKAPAPKPTATGPSAACVKATKSVKKLQKMLKLAKRKHLRVKAKRLSRKLTHARLAKIRAC